VTNAIVARHEFGDRKLELGDLKHFVHGADLFSRQSDGTTTAAQSAKHEISLRCANTHRVNHWAEVMQGLGEPDAVPAPDGVRPTRFIYKRCGRLIETLPALQYDPDRPEHVLKVDAGEEGVGGEDSAVALRHLVATKSQTLMQRKLRAEWLPGKVYWRGETRSRISMCFCSRCKLQVVGVET
jgi:hypothetical protein